jgi:hypothetical protein
MLKKRLVLQTIITFCLTVGAFSQSNLGRASKLHAPAAEWSIALSGQAVRESSPVLADINSNHAGNEIIVAGGDGRVYAYSGNGTKLWEYDTGSPIESSPAVGDIDGDGDLEIVVGLGSQYVTGEDGGVICLSHTGQRVWRFTDIEDRHGGTGGGSDGHPDGVYSTPALGDLDNDGDLEIIFGAWDHWLRSLNHNGTILWSIFMRDTIWSSPALGDVDRDGYLDVVIGVDAHYEAPFGTPDGGSLHVFTRDGAEILGFPQHIDEIIQSSPALGDLDGDGWLDIVVGTGGYYGRGKQVHAWDHTGNYLSGWPKSTGDYCFSSPASGDIDNDDQLEVVIGCNDRKIYAWDGDGTQKFAKTVQDHSGNSNWGVGTSPILADVDGDGVAEILFSYNYDVGILEGSGTQTSIFYETNYTVSNSPAVGDINNDGKLEVVVAGGANATQGMIYIWELDVTSDANPWPTFHRDAARNGHVPVAPVLSASPASLDFMHQTGDTTEPTLSFHLTNTGDCAANWTASAPGALDVTPGSGTIEATVTDYDVVNVTVLNPTSYAPGTTHNLGSVTVNGTSSCGTVDSPSVPVTFYASDFSRLYLPATMRQYASVRYSDDFSDPTSGWSIAEDGKTGSGYFGLEYGVHISDIDSNYPRAVAQGPFYASGDYAVQVEARGTTMAFARCGIIFNASADMSRYDYFFIDNRYPTDPNQGSKLRRYESGSHEALKTKPVSGTTVELYEPNILRVEVVGSQIRAYVDGIQIISYDDSSSPGGGYIGLYAEHAYYGQPDSPETHWDQYHKANCHFDNLIVTRP